MTAAIHPARPLVAAERPPSLAAATSAIAGRTIVRYLRTPQVLVLGIVQSALFLVIFRYVFGGAIAGAGVPYVDYLIPGFVAANVLFVCSNVITAVAEDASAGFTDRLRSLPVPRVAILAGRNIADLALLAVILAATAALGLAVGWRPTGDAGQLLAAAALCVVYGAAFGWLFQLLGLFAANAQAAQGIAMIVFPLTFVSSAYVPIGTMPGWMQVFARNQPVTMMVDSIRDLCLGHPAGHAVVWSLGWVAVMLAITVPATIARFSRR